MNRASAKRLQLRLFASSRRADRDSPAAAAGNGTRLAMNSRPSTETVSIVGSSGSQNQWCSMLAVLPSDLELDRCARALGGNAQRDRVGVLADHQRGSKARDHRSTSRDVRRFPSLLARAESQRRERPRSVSSEAAWCRPQMSVYSSSTPQPCGGALQSFAVGCQTPV